MFFNRKQRFTRHSIEEIKVAGLGRLCDSIDALSVMRHSQEGRSRWKISIPYVVMYILKMPDSFSCVGVECQQCIREKIVADPVAAVEVDGRRACRDVHNPALGIERHPSPVVGSARSFPGIFRPRLIAELAWMRNGVKAPEKSSGANVERTDIARRSRKGLRHLAAHD